MNADGFTWSTPIPEPEGAEYGAHTLTVNGLMTVYRTAKTTPTKLGQFVTLWRRSDAGPIRPFDTSDGVFLFVVKVHDEEHLGHFVFPVETLVEHDIVSTNFSGGKRAIRVYPPWVAPTSVQAVRTQRWQMRHFGEFPDMFSSTAVQLNCCSAQLLFRSTAVPLN
ncbi:MepB family protein [Rhodococcus erythropolis]|uniref:MepB family protein n=1 Tax=Rhodococcus erythropolis TaxID=1833 RepID=UPI00294A974B|nr:MepB family protein [Rhodococcus erythropolis]MDV6275834.1 MepB family protein [Rhodococcus erythropolis]